MKFSFLEGSLAACPPSSSAQGSTALPVPPPRYLQPSPVALTAVLLEMWGYFSFQAHLDFWLHIDGNNESSYLPLGCYGTGFPVPGEKQWDHGFTSAVADCVGRWFQALMQISEKIIFWNNWKCVGTVRLQGWWLCWQACFQTHVALFPREAFVFEGTLLSMASPNVSLFFLSFYIVLCGYIYSLYFMEEISERHYRHTNGAQPS